MVKGSQLSLLGMRQSFALANSYDYLWEDASRSPARLPPFFRENVGTSFGGDRGLHRHRASVSGFVSCMADCRSHRRSLWATAAAMANGNSRNPSHAHGGTWFNA